jgi:hypothetical protein
MNRKFILNVCTGYTYKIKYVHLNLGLLSNSKEYIVILA